MAKENFRISSGLKNLIGKELITDEFVAVFELVKNSFDANATKVQIIFEKPTDLEKGKILILDNGKGMNDDDLQNKWLFVAYSAKKEGTEDDDYRNKIKNRIYAGAKGVGRFSCDRLGKYLLLKTTKQEKNAQTETLQVNWQEFEDKPLLEFKDVNIIHQKLGKSNQNGTSLEITGLRDIWDREKLLKLKQSLSKLINPNQENDISNFSIELICKEELSNDKKEKEDRNIVNGIIKNFIFEKLNYKTTQLKCSIDDKGEVITTTLTDRGKRIYTLKEHNIYSTSINSKEHFLSNVSIHLFQLNRSAKANFAKDMGIPSVDYGSVFLYKNGFRIYPFGEEGDDSLKIDRRKQQGYSRNLGTRDLLGRIEIYGTSEFLKESTSRAEGLIKNEHYNLLLKFFEDKALKRLEEYVVNIIEWGDDRVFELDEKINIPGLSPADVKKEITEYIKKLSNAKNVISIDYDKNFINILNENIDQSINKALRGLAKKAKNQNDKVAFKQAVKLKDEWNKITADTKKAEVKAQKAEDKALKSEEVLKYTIVQNSFLTDSVKADTKELQSLLHHTEKSTYWITKHINKLIKGIEQKIPDDKLFEIIRAISWENQKIFSFTKYHKSTKFDTFVEKINQDIVSFINEYANNVCKFYDEYQKLTITIKYPPTLKFKMEFSPVDITVIIDNLLSNSVNYHSGKVLFEWEDVSTKQVKLHIIDNGDGINKDVIDKIFDFRFTTTRGGSGLGLYHIKKALGDLNNSSIDVNSKATKGAEFIITFKK